MAELEETRPSVQDSLEQVTELLHKHELVTASTPHQEGDPRRELVETLVHTLHLAELQKLLDSLHPAAYLLEAAQVRARPVSRNRPVAARRAV